MCLYCTVKPEAGLKVLGCKIDCNAGGGSAAGGGGTGGGGCRGQGASYFGRLGNTFEK